MLLSMLYMLTSFLSGYGTNYILPYLGVYSGKKAVDYYAEVHTRRQNVVVHIIGMPFTITGMTLWIPALLQIVFGTPPFLTQHCLYCFYLGLYSYISLDVCVYYSFMYYPAVMFGGYLYTGGWNDVLIGLVISTIALVLQEFVGHKMSGDPPSRPEAVLNAILYAKYFSAKSLKNILRYKL